jgi:hypothetical protein
MKNKTTSDYLRKIEEILPSDKYNEIMKELIFARNEHLEAFWNIISAGYSFEFAQLNYINLYDYIKDKDIDYTDALRTVYTFYPGLNAGIYVKKPEWYEMN